MIDMGRGSQAGSLLSPDINALGQITGVNDVGHAFVDTNGVTSGGQVDLGTLVGGNSEGYGINASGQVTGSSSIAGNIATHAFIDPDGAGPQPMVDMGALGGIRAGISSIGYSINNSGQVTGFSYNSSFQQHAFIYPDAAGGARMVDLGTLGGSESQGYGINASGQVVGISLTTTGVFHGFIDPDGAGPQPMQDLNDLIVPGSGLVLQQVFDINDSGQITGSGFVSANGQSHAIVLTPDTIAPVITCPAAVSGTTQPSLTPATATDNLDPSPVVTSNAPSIFPYGITTVTWTATDAVGNHASCDQTVTLVDGTPPSIGAVLTPSLPASGWYNADVSLYWDVADPESGVISTVNCPDAVNPLFISIDTPVTGNSYTCQATNGFGLPASATVSVKRDTVPPVISHVPADFSVPATDASGATVAYSEPTATDAASGVAGVSCTPPSGSNFALGATAVNCTATDLAGNSTCTGFQVTVQNTVAPTISCPADVVSTDGASVALGNATATDSFGAPLVPTHNAPASFPAGNTAVIWTAIDNSSLSASCTQHVFIFAPLAQRQVSAGRFHTCEVKTDRSVSCWGDNSLGQAPPAVAGTFVAVSVGFRNHTCGLTVDGDVACWGSNGAGQAPATVPGPFTAISTGDEYTCAMRTDGTVNCWGTNGFGEAPGVVAGPFGAISAGVHHGCGVKVDGSVTCWGNNADGQAPSTVPGAFVAVSAGGRHSCAVRTDGNVNCWGFDGSGEAPAVVAGPFNVVAAGVDHSCGVRTDGNVACWGDNGAGQAPVFVAGPFAGLSATSSGTCGVKTDDTLECWGSNNDWGQEPQLGLNLTTLPEGTVGTGYIQQEFSLFVTNTPQANGGVYVPFSGQFTASNLPAGLTLSTTGILPGTPTTAGTFSVAVTGTDTNGFSASQNYAVTINPADTTPPTITPAVTGTSGTNGWYTTDVTVSWVVIDDVDPNPVKTGCATTTVSTETASQVITCSAVDRSNNAASKSVTIKLDKTTPVLGTLPGVGPIEATGAGGAAVTYTAPSATDNFGTAQVQCAPASGTTLSVGNHAVTCTATDDAGLAATGSFNVTVQDTTPPTLTLPAPITTTATGPNGAVVSYSATASDLVSGDVAVSCTPVSGSTFPVGTTSVSCSSSDGAGNTATGSFNVTVNALTVNTPPAAINDAFTVAHAGTASVTVPAPGVIGNDSDLDGNALTVVGATATTPRVITLTNAAGTASGGTVRLNFDGSFIYTPSSAAFTGIRSFTYQVTDGQATSNTATVSLTINRAPNAANDSATTNVATPVTINVVANDTAFQGATINPASVVIAAVPANGGVVVNANGSAVYTPNAGFGGTDTFAYTVQDSRGYVSNTAVVTIFVPMAIDDDYGTTANNRTTQVISRNGATSVRANDLPTTGNRIIKAFSGPTCVQGACTASMGLTLTKSGAFRLTLTVPPSATTNAAIQASKRGIYQFRYTLTLNGVTTAPATATIFVR